MDFTTRVAVTLLAAALADCGAPSSAPSPAPAPKPAVWVDEQPAGSGKWASIAAEPA